MIGGAHMRVGATREALPEQFHGQFGPEDDLALCLDVGGREDTATLIVEDRNTGDLMACAVIGRDDAGMVVIYYARSWMKGLGAAAIKGLFGAATIIKAPLRVHTHSLAAFHAYARMLGASEALEALDADGLPMGVFHG